MSEPRSVSEDERCAVSSKGVHCLHPIYEKTAILGAPADQYSVTETVCCHCGRKATLTVGCAVTFHGKFAPDDPFRGRVS